MPIDTTVVNGRFVTATGIDDRPISIHHGAVLPEAELQDVWRTIDASGFLVLPGLIQPGNISGDDALATVRQGTTVALPETIVSPDEAASAAFDHLDVLDVTDLDLAEDDSNIELNRRILLCRAPRPDLNDAFAGRTVILSGLALLPEQWLTGDTHQTILRVGSDPVPSAWLERAAMIQVPLSLLAEEIEIAWAFVEDEAAPVHVIIDQLDIPALPLLVYQSRQQHTLSLERIVDVVSSTPARVFGLQPDKGDFSAGGNGDLVVFDPDAEDPYRPAPWPGRVILSLQRGELLYYNGQIHANAGAGQRLELDH